MTKEEYVISKIKNMKKEKANELLDTLRCGGHLEEYSKTELIKISRNLLGLTKSYPPTSETYWVKRGWSKEEAWHKVKNAISLRPKSLSPFSMEYWIEKGYSEGDAVYKANSIRPIRKEFWIEKGYSEKDAIIKAKETKEKNNNKGALESKKSNTNIKHTSKRCKEYYISKGFDEETAKLLLKNHQTKFSLDKCIHKYGLDKGIFVWQKRQEKWQNSLNINGNLDNIKKASISIDHLNKKFDGNVEEYAKHLNYKRKMNLSSTLEGFINNIQKLFEKNPNYVYFGVERIIKMFPDIQYELLGIEDRENFMLSLGIELHPRSFKDSKRNICKHVDEGFLRSSHEILFYDLLKKYNINFTLEKPYNDSNMRCDFYIVDKDIYIEICPLLYYDEKYTKKMLVKQRLFGCILLNEPNRYEKYIKGLL